MQAIYRQLFAIPGVMGFSAAAFLGRLPAGMIALAVILPISEYFGSYTLAGAVAACTMIGMALGAPFSGRLVDRYGQGKMLYIFAGCNLIATATLIACIYFHTPLTLLCLAGTATGVTRLSTGTLARVRWAYVIQANSGRNQAGMLQAAYSFESIIDEIVFISAPIVATFLCTAVHSLAGLLGSMLAFFVGALLLAVQKSTQPVTVPTKAKSLSAFKMPGLQIIVLAIFFIGISAGAVEVIVVARADALGSRALAGLLLALLALSSMLAGLWYGAQQFKLSPYDLWRRSLFGLFLTLIPFTFSSSLITQAIALFIAGLAIAPTSIAGQVLTERILPSQLLNEGMSIVVTAMILGMAVGGWGAGSFIDNINAYFAGIIPGIAVLISLIIALWGSKIFNYYFLSHRDGMG